MKRPKRRLAGLLAADQFSLSFSSLWATAGRPQTGQFDRAAVANFFLSSCSPFLDRDGDRIGQRG
jgi:hypothetical protein